MKKKVRNSIKKEFNSEPVYNEKYLKTKIKSYKGKIDTKLHNTKIPKEDSLSICLSVILIDSVYRKNKNYYPKVFLEECKYIVRKQNMSNHIANDINISSYDHDQEALIILMSKILKTIGDAWTSLFCT